MLVNQTTNLKSLKFGKDRPGGGSSNQPYIKSSFPNDLSEVGTTGGPDFILRGGTLIPGRITKDVSRLTQMLFDFKSPNGLLFTAKQNILSRTSVVPNGGKYKLNSGAYLPTSTILQAAGNPIGLHLNKQGINPFKGIAGDESPLNFLNEFDPLGQPTYLEITKNYFNENNRFISNLEKFITSQNKLSKDATNLMEYSGGPGSVLGIGKTIIKLPNDRDRTYLKKNSFSYRLTNNTSFDYSDIKNKLSPGYIFNNLGDFRKIPESIPSKQSNTSIDYNNPDKRIESRVNLGNPGSIFLKNRKYDYNPTNSSENAGSQSLDKITSYPLYKTKGVGGIPQSKELNDLVKFRIGVIDNINTERKTYIHFRAFIDEMSDNYTSEWSSNKFMGRGEEFFRYNGFTRQVSLAWTIVAQSKGELIPMYQKLNYLASSLTPDFSEEVGYMRGNLVTLTVGGYFYEQPGIITSLNYTVPQESPWEIGIDTKGETDNTVKELPHIIKVTGFNFKPIHNFTPRLQKNTYNNEGKLTKFGNERYIGLKNGLGKEFNNYDVNNFIDVNPTSNNKPTYTIETGELQMIGIDSG